jgi:hypothetical protein
MKQYEKDKLIASLEQQLWNVRYTLVEPERQELVKRLRQIECIIYKCPETGESCHKCPMAEALGMGTINDCGISRLRTGITKAIKAIT